MRTSGLPSAAAGCAALTRPDRADPDRVPQVTRVTSNTEHTGRPRRTPRPATLCPWSAYPAAASTMRTARGAPGAIASTCRSRRCRSRGGARARSAGYGRADRTGAHRTGADRTGAHRTGADPARPGGIGAAGVGLAPCVGTLSAPAARQPGQRFTSEREVVSTCRALACDPRMVSAADPLLVARRHVDLLRVRSAACRLGR